MKVLKIFLLFQTVASLLQYSTKPVFITGANSQVGRRVVRILDNNNVATRCLVRNYDKSSFIFVIPDSYGIHNWHRTCGVQKHNTPKYCQNGYSFRFRAKIHVVPYDHGGAIYRFFSSKHQ